MPRILGRSALYLAATLLSGCLLLAQQPDDAKAAPVPPQIALAKTVFIANAAGDSSIWLTGGPDRTYNEFYSAVKTWGRYEIASSPSNADLAFEVSFEDQLRGYTNLRLTIRDIKTNIPIWWFTEPVRSANRVSTYDKNYKQAMDRLVDDVKKLVVPAATANGETRK
ncbi:MAG: hypothetical protein ACRD3B_01515 [Candidatus Sulfotelmatobacter sp.]